MSTDNVHCPLCRTSTVQQTLFTGVMPITHVRRARLLNEMETVSECVIVIVTLSDRLTRRHAWLLVQLAVLTDPNDEQSSRSKVDSISVYTCKCLGDSKTSGGLTRASRWWSGRVKKFLRCRHDMVVSCSSCLMHLAHLFFLKKKKTNTH